MFKKDKLSVLAWIVLIIALSIPVFNIIFAVYLFIRRRTSETVKNFFVAYLILWVLAWIGLFAGAFENMQGLFG
ncbi:hypothetical protein [Candidatus Xianfuyuplasma coldseepsis]|uniref:Uncharacterized protein n=1 Tax=Candidatus Xianfuyuplasma coldseepsis TaxID=2782163 RepID=A0A7L7KPQ2_9MOLU|nr:hypothetical protein [Xianfuyuplasma coldseepsis]QMS84657.1 hypothetical protein G4Z02_02455 [Xianfuyuplasma coldseepsis]